MREPEEARADIRQRLIHASPESVFAAFSDPERLARWWGPEGFASTFEPSGEDTLVGWRQVFDSAEHYRQIAEFVARANEQNLDRMAAAETRRPVSSSTSRMIAASGSSPNSIPPPGSVHFPA